MSERSIDEAPVWYRTRALEAIGDLARQGLRGEKLLRAWRAYEAGMPAPQPAPSRLLLPPFGSIR